MKIVTRIRASAVLAVVIAIAAAVVLVVGIRQADTSLRRSTDATEVINRIFELSMLTTDYLTYHEPRAERQWLANYAQLGELLDGLDPPTAEDQVLVDRISANSQEAHRLFAEMVAHGAARGSSDVDPAVWEEYQARLTARLLIVMQSMVSDSVLLGHHAAEVARVSQEHTFTTVLILALFGVLVMTSIGLSTNRTVVRPLVSLTDSAREVGRGHLGTRSGVRTNDEVGELARAFDNMVEALQQSYLQLELEITDRRRAETELSEYRDHLQQLVDARTTELTALNEELQRATRAKDDFLASMSHELRTPLNSIIGFTDLMLKGLAGDLNTEQRRQLTMVFGAGQHLLTLIDDVLDLARMDAGRVDTVFSPCSITDAVSLIVEMMQPLALARGIRLMACFEPDVPDSIQTDTGRVHQVLLNLVSNAVKFTHKGGVELTVRPDGPDAVAVDVRDTGIGIPEDEIEAVFERFHRGRGGGPAGQSGTGLGLAISRRLATALGGTISVTSEVGVGSVFTFRLPRVAPTA